MGSKKKENRASDEELLRAIHDHYAPVAGTQDVADECGISRQAVGRRLRNFERQGLIETDKVGRSRIWWMTADGLKELKKKSD